MLGRVVLLFSMIVEVKHSQTSFMFSPFLGTAAINSQCLQSLEYAHSGLGFVQSVPGLLDIPGQPMDLNVADFNTRPNHFSKTAACVPEVIPDMLSVPLPNFPHENLRDANAALKD